MIYVVRGRQVMLDSDLATLYQIETKVFNQAVKRNEARFPESFRFQLTKEEYDSLRSQIVTLNESTGRGSHRKYLPYVFTEQGIAMLSAVLRSDIAIQVSINIMNAFVEMRNFISSNSLLFEKISTIELRQLKYQEETDQKFNQVFAYISDHEESIQTIFFEGQIYDAASFLTKIVQSAEREIILIDGYVDNGTLDILSKKKENVSVIIFTRPSRRLTDRDINLFNAEYPSLEVKYTDAFHDRFMILDGENGYHIGTSLKDAGKKCFEIDEIQDSCMIDGILQRLERGKNT